MMKAIAGIAPVALAAQTQGAFAQPMHDGWGPWMGWTGPLMMLLFLALLVLAVIGLWRLVGGSRSPRGAASDNSLEILRERFARGEIDEEEFEARKRTLDR